MNHTKIEYLDYTWNPIVGCAGVNCAVRSKCWARATGKRFKHRCVLCYTFTPHLHKERLEEPLHLSKPSRIGVCFMGDLFDSGVHPDWQGDVLETVEKALRHTFIFLTKQPQNIPRWMRLPVNAWLGVTVNEKADLNRIKILKGHYAGLLFVSFEPLYEDLGDVDLRGISWIIIGAQTRPDRQPAIKWTNDLVDQARKLEIPIFMKNNLKNYSRRCYPIQEFPVGR